MPNVKLIPEEDIGSVTGESKHAAVKESVSIFRDE